MPDRHEFPTAVRVQLARRAGHRCSNPACRAPTSGPSDARASLASDVGVAAHITAASVGGPRYEPRLTSVERRSINNGVWLCQNDAKQIDDDPRRFSIELLRRWRSAAETAAAQEQGRAQAQSAALRGVFVEYDKPLIDDAELLRRDVSEFLVDVGANVVWSTHSSLVYMVLYELALNALRHGNAQLVRLRSDRTGVTLLDDGARFGLADLRRGGRGGHLVVTELERTAAGGITVRHDWARGLNRWTLIDEPSVLGGNTPCGVAVTGRGPEMLAKARFDFRTLAHCDEVHIYAPELWSASDWFILKAAVGEFIQDKTVWVHGLGDDEAMRGIVSRIFPNATAFA